MARIKWIAVVAALIAAACSGGTDADPAAYCSALETMFKAQPAGGLVTDSFEAEMSAYSETAREAAALAPEGQRAALGSFAEFLEALAADPTAEGTGEQAFAVMASMITVQNHAENQCGIAVEAIQAAVEREAAEERAVPTLRTDIAEIPPVAIATADALVPPGFTLSFESVRTEDEDSPVIVMAPVGWERSDFLGTTFEPPENSDFGFFTEMTVKDGCDGLCAPKDWTVIMDNMESGPFALLSGEGTVLVDRRLEGPAGRVVAYRDDSAFHPVEVVATRWDDRADHYFECHVQLDDDDVELWPAFVAACEAAVPLWIPAS